MSHRSSYQFLSPSESARHARIANHAAAKRISYGQARRELAAAAYTPTEAQLAAAQVYLDAHPEVTGVSADEVAQALAALEAGADVSGMPGGEAAVAAKAEQDAAVAAARDANTQYGKRLTEARLLLEKALAARDRERAYEAGRAAGIAQAKRSAPQAPPAAPPPPAPASRVPATPLQSPPGMQWSLLRLKGVPIVRQATALDGSPVYLYRADDYRRGAY